MTAVKLGTPPLVAYRNAVEDLELVVSLLDLDVGTVAKVDGELRIYRSLESLGFTRRDGLVRLRRLGLVEMGAAHYYGSGRRSVFSTPIKDKTPLPILTPAGRRLALAELG